MPTLPDVFIMPSVPDSEVKDIETETEEEGEFNLEKERNSDGTWKLTFRRKVPS